VGDEWNFRRDLGNLSGETGPNGLIPQNLTVFGNKVLFEGLDKNLNSNLWVTDGTAAGTSELSVNGQNTQNFVPQDFTVLGSKVLFNGQDNKNISTGDLTCG